MKFTAIAALIFIVRESSAFVSNGRIGRIDTLKFQVNDGATKLKSTAELKELPLNHYSSVASQGKSHSKKPEELRARLEEVSMSIRDASSVTHMVSQAAIDKVDPDVLSLLAKYAGLKYKNIPKTWGGLIERYLTSGGGGFIVLSMIVTLFFRLSLSSSVPLGVGDLVAVVTTRIFWEVQEWLIHSNWFHGGGNYRARNLFKSHDFHHDLPYYHLAVEPLPLVLVWWAVVFSLLMVACGCGMPPSILATVFFSYQASAYAYSFIHAAVHSMIPFEKGSYFKKAKMNHIKHHISPDKHLNLGPNRIDKLMGTDSYEERLKKAGYDI